ncbi:MAG TPA: 3-oxoacyl-[acyl-carrier-protein] synthase III C-terminal domain-containing protein [Myxococcaceae bacterium]|nr:3-oxoacyl-[acyl-carrier-protein] synthase III C-terminal domain-containing protein [Myxococcaceae bacterium]
MTARALIESLGVALPDRRVTMEEVVAGCRHRLGFSLVDFTGIQAHRRAGDREFAFDLARRAVETCLSRSRHAPADVDLIVNCNISRVDAPGRFSYEPATAGRLAAWFGMDRALTFDITSACAGMFTGLALAADFLATGQARRALVVSGEYITHLSDTAQRTIASDDDLALACLTLGDAGAAVLVDAVDPAQGAGFEAIDLVSLGRYSRLCTCGPTYLPEGGAIMRTESVRLGLVGIREGVRHLQLVLGRLGRRPRDYQHFIAHQTSLATLTGAKRAAQQVFPEEEDSGEDRTVVNLAERGNTASTSHFVALWDHIHNGRIRSGDRILFTTVASGLVAGIGSYQLDDLPSRLRGDPPAKVPPRVEAGPGGVDWKVPGQALPRVRFEATGVAGEGCEGETLALCRAAGEAALKASSHGRKDFTHLIFTGVHRTDWISEPAIAAFIAGELRMNEARLGPGPSTLAFDLTQGTAGFLTACEVARHLVAAAPGRRILLAGAEVDPNAGTRPDLPLGIRASGVAVVVDASPDPRKGLGGAVIRRFPGRTDTWTSVTHFDQQAPFQVVAGREEAVGFLLEQLPGAVEALMRLEGIDPGKVSAVLLNEPVPGFRRRAAEALRIEPGRVFDPPEERVDRYSCSLPCLLHRARETGRVAGGDVGLLVEVASGLQVACAVYYF